jgi:hypothetical protein
MPQAQRLLAPFAVAALALTSAPLFAGQLKGKITGQDKLFPEVYVEAAKPEAHRFTWREPSPTVKGDFHALTASPSRDVCIVALAGSNANPHDPVLVKLTGGRTTPSTIVVSPGTRLSFKNSDPFPHKLYQVKDDKWTANVIAPNSAREWAAPGPGKYEIRDELFPSVRMWIVVEATAVDFVYPDREGSFTMSLPAGEYTIKAYFDGKPVGNIVAGLRVTEKVPTEVKEPLNLGAESK